MTRRISHAPRARAALPVLAVCAAAFAGRALAAADAPAAAAPITGGTLGEMFLKGGLMMWPILACSVVTVALLLERLVALRRRAVFPEGTLARARELMAAGRLEEVDRLCADDGSPFARLLRPCLSRADATGFEMEAALEEAGSRVLFDLRHHTKALHVIADISPLLGLMGTVTGMIKAFNVVAASGALGRTELLAAGISEALLTTAFGLIVAIPAMLVYHYARSKADGYLREMEDACLEMLVDLRRKRTGA